MDNNENKRTKEIRETVGSLSKLITEHNKYNTEFTKNLNKNFESLRETINSCSDKHLTQLSPEIQKIGNLLRTTQLDAISELESEKILGLLHRLNSSGEEPHSDWMEYFTLLQEYMSENGHCYFEKGQRYKGTSLGNWVINQRESNMHLIENDIRSKYLNSLTIRDKIILNYGRSTLDEYRENILDDQKKSENSPEIIKREKEHRIKFLEYINKDGGVNMDDTDEINIATHGGLLKADLVDNYFNHACWSWSNQDATWMRYFKELKKFYIVNGHSVVPATYKINDLALGTWVLRVRQDYKKGRIHNQKIQHSFDSPSSPSFLNRHHLLWNLFFIRETDLTKALSNADDAIDIIDAGERLKLANIYDISLGGTE